MKKKIAYLLVLALLFTLFPGFSVKTQAAYTEITAMTISSPGETEKYIEKDQGIAYTKKSGTETTIYKLTVDERGWLFFYNYGTDNLYPGYFLLYSDTSMTMRVGALYCDYKTYEYAQLFYYVDAGTYYLENSYSFSDQTAFVFFLPDSAVISHKLVKAKDNESYTDTVTFTPQMGTTYLGTGIVSPEKVKSELNNQSKNVEDVYTITKNGDYTVKAVFTDPEWQPYPVMYSFTVNDIGEKSKDEKSKDDKGQNDKSNDDDSKTADAKLNVTSKTIKVGETFKLKMTGTKVVSFKSSKKSVAKVSSSGKVTGKKKGSATIKVTCENGETYTCKVKVTK